MSSIVKLRKGSVMDVKDQVVLVTGANRGIGKAYVEEFLKAGARKVYMGVRNLDTVRDMAEAHPDKLIPLELDITNPEHIREAVEKASDTTILINNAGVLFMGSLFEENQLINARTEMEVNYFGTLAMIQAFAPVLKKNGGGLIAAVSSVAGFLMFPGIASYSASKTAIRFIIQAARQELAADGIKVMGVYPGPIDTDMAKDFDMEKASPCDVAKETIAAIESGVDDVFPDPFAKELYAAYKVSPQKAEENIWASLLSMEEAA